MPGRRPGQHGSRSRSAWTALQPGRTMDAVLAMDVASDADDIRAAAALLDVPSQNIVFATTDGHIGYQAPGRIPIRAGRPRRAGPVGRHLAAPGLGQRATTGRATSTPTTCRARSTRPTGSSSRRTSAVTPAGVGPVPDQRLGLRLPRAADPGPARRRPRRRGKLDAADMSAIQLDQHNPYADVLVPALLQLHIADDVRRRRPGPAAHAGTACSRDDSAAAAYFAAVWADVLRSAFADDLPDGYGPDGGSRWLEVVRNLLDEPDVAVVGRQVDRRASSRVATRC